MAHQRLPPRTEAKRRYITTLIETMHAYASTTPEARELVAELEFVWEQVKSNTASLSSSHSSAAASPEQHPQRRMYTGEEAQRGGGGGGGGGAGGDLRLLRPVSEPDDAGVEDEDGEGEDEYKDAHSENGADNAEGGAFVARRSRDLDIRNRKWRKRIEAALAKMTVEVAALREQMEARRLLHHGGGREDGSRMRRRVWIWVSWVLGTVVRHVLIDAAVLGVLYWWLGERGRGKWDQREKVEQGLRMLVAVVRERAGRIRGLRRRGKLVGGG